VQQQKSKIKKRAEKGGEGRGAENKSGPSIFIKMLGFSAQAEIFSI